MQLSAFQDGFSAALVAGGAASIPAWMDPLAAQPGFAVYRNSGRKAALDALRANYPTIAQLVGEDWFQGAAQSYWRELPPTDGLLMRYGAEFPDFLDRFGPAAELPWLGAVARLDLAWTQAHLAPDAAPLDAAWMASQPPDVVAAACIAPHPSARWLWCHDFPAYSIWQRHRERLALDAELPWRAEGALLTRPQGAVQWYALPHAGIAFLNACAAGEPLAAAAEQAVGSADPHAPPPDLAALIALLLGAGALQAPDRAPSTAMPQALPKETP